MSSNRRKNVPSEKSVRKTALIIAVIAVSLIVAVVILRGVVKEKFGVEKVKEVLSANAETGSISMSVTGSGTLSDDDVEKLEIPDGVKIEKLYVSRGDTVAVGDKLASVDENTVLSAMSDVSSKIDIIDKQIDAASGEKISSVIKSPVRGRVKTIYAHVGSDVASIMYESGALMLISTDGYMLLELETDKLSKGETVNVSCSDGRSYTGFVSDFDGVVADILITDDGPRAGETVKVENISREYIGEGVLEINEPIKITGYTGTVKAVKFGEDKLVKINEPLIELSDTGYSSNYHTLLADREELEEELRQLITIYKENGINSTVAGTVKEINAEEGSTGSSASSANSMAYTSAAGSADAEKRTFNICPDENMSVSVRVDESEILSVAVGQKATVKVDSIEDKTFEGTVTEIDKFGESAGGVTSYTATIQIAKTDGMLAGMSASVTIIIDSVADGINIPADALNKTSAGYYVYTSYDEKEGTLGGMKEVTVGVMNSKTAEITSGLYEGETVYYIDPSKKNLVSIGGMTFDMDEMAAMSEGSSYDSSYGAEG